VAACISPSRVWTGHTTIYQIVPVGSSRALAAEELYTNDVRESRSERVQQQIFQCILPFSFKFCQSPKDTFDYIIVGQMFFSSCLIREAQRFLQVAERRDL
jgi:hypothetical protein